jgi:hypothetical protein
MRLPRVLLLPVFLASACSSNPAPPNAQPKQAQGDAPEVVMIRLDYGLGGWGNGADYSLEVARDGRALYTGRTRAVFAGQYQAQADTAATRQFFERAAQPNRLTPQSPGCADQPTRQIVVRYAGGTEKTFGVDCNPTEGMIRFAGQLDQFFAALTWSPLKRAT